MKTFLLMLSLWFLIAASAQSNNGEVVCMKEWISFPLIDGGQQNERIAVRHENIKEIRLTDHVTIIMKPLPGGGLDSLHAVWAPYEAWPKIMKCLE